jgi:hypothetical protein
LKFDVSTILLVIVAVIPGLFAQRTRNQLVPRSFATQGASAELAELVALGVATHGILAFLLATVSLLIGWIHKGHPDYYFSKLDSLIVSQWLSLHVVEACLIASVYLFVSFFEPLAWIPVRDLAIKQPFYYTSVCEGDLASDAIRRNRLVGRTSHHL